MEPAHSTTTCPRCQAIVPIPGGAARAFCPACGAPVASPDAPCYALVRGGVRLGTHTAAQVREMLARGQIGPGEQLWHEPSQAWVPAGSLGAPAAPAAPALPAASGGAPPPALPAAFGGAPPPALPAAFGGAPPPALPAAFGGAPPPAPGGFPPPVPGGFAFPPAGPGAAVGTAPPPGDSLGERARRHLGRAFRWNLRDVPVTDEERTFLVSLSVDEESARRYLVWRHSVLFVVVVPTVITALLAVAGISTKGLSGFGSFLEAMHALSIFAMPVCAAIAARTWSRHRTSRRVLLAGWLISFLAPLVIALFPLSWRIELEGLDAEGMQMQAAVVGLVAAIAYYVMLMPAVLSLIPGILRACLRIKALLPESILPGWFLVAMSPIYVLLFLVVFVTVNQIAGNALLILGVLALTVAPTLYLVNGRVFIRPHAGDDDTARMRRVQQGVTAVSWLGVALLAVFAATAEVFGMKLIGTEEGTSMVRPWDVDLYRLPIEYVTRSLYTTVVAADLFMAMNLSVWHHTKQFVGSPAANEYDRLMSEIEEAGGRG